jgi:CRISPR type I-E-associated protein CasB/Cse2
MSDASANERAASAIARAWWLELNGRDGRPADTGARARLRRADPSAALAEERTLILLRRLMTGRAASEPTFERMARRACMLACVLSCVREDEDRAFGRAIGRTAANDAASAPLSAIRFRNLLDAQTDDEIVTALRRAVRMTGGTANVRDLAEHILRFGTDGQRRRLILDYHDAFDASLPTSASAPPAEAGA